MRENRHRTEPKINCSAFQRQEGIIKDLADKINSSKTIQEKSKFAQDLLMAAEILSSCAGYMKENIDCKNCRFILNLRKKTANIIIKAKELT